MENMIQVLHIEDDPADAELVKAKLTRSGLACQITKVTKKDQFETALRVGVPDIIIADYRLPMYDGMSALGLANNFYPDVPFIFVSGVMGEETAIEALNHGATDYILKQNPNPPSGHELDYQCRSRHRTGGRQDFGSNQGNQTGS